MKKNAKIEERAEAADRVTWLSVGLNIMLTVLKLILGWVGHSSAMVADAIHSMSDFLTDFAVMIGMHIARRPIDDNHPYGHGKYETLSAVFVGLILASVGLSIIWNAIRVIFSAFYWNIIPQAPSIYIVIVGLVSIISKEWLYQRTMRIAKMTGNEALRANAWHHRSDALSSIGVVLGVIGAIVLGGKWVLLDAGAAFFVGGMLVWIALCIVKRSIDNLMEHGMEASEMDKILSLVQSTPQLTEPHHLRARWVGAVAVVEMHFRVKPEMTVEAAHEIATDVEDRLKHVFGDDAIITVHVEPQKSKE